jgi:DNA topoisomerase-1
MQSKTGGKSAGRVQSVALKLIVDREKEIEAFEEEEYWTIKAIFNDFEATLDKYNYKDIEINSELEADEILNKLSKAFKIDDISKKSKKKQSKFPFITSTLQQDASNKLNFNAKKTMSLAQKLYEGIDIGAETTGLITYMRTDSTRLSEEFIKNTFGYIKVHFGEEYLGYVKTPKKKENVQDAHEAIRPTNINRTPDSVKQYLSNDEYKLYRLIYYRALAYLMADAKVNLTTIILDNNNYQFKATGQTLVFDGYLKVYNEYESSEEKELPPFEKYNSNILIANSTNKEQHFTKPPARYTEAKLIEEMEKLGIGRPSTYATIMSTITERDYVKLLEKKFHPTEIGTEITEKLQAFFSHLINVKYTAAMETSLDEVAEGKEIWYKLLKEFYDDFEPMVKNAFEKMEKKEAVKTGEDCPNCGSPLVIRKGKYGEFISCSNYPKCKYIKTEKKEATILTDCPKCGGKIIEKRTKKGKIFYGCNNYPKCDFALWDKPTGEKCPNCGNLLVEKKNKIKCNSCDYEK